METGRRVEKQFTCLLTALIPQIVAEQLAAANHL
jgi:hypothetical protein